MENLSRVFQNKKKTKKTASYLAKRSNFITQFKIEFLLPFVGCRKVLRKMPVFNSIQSLEINDLRVSLDKFLILDRYSLPEAELCQSGFTVLSLIMCLRSYRERKSIKPARHISLIKVACMV